MSVREIAKAVGLSEMTVFRHFPSKYAMLMAAMRRAPYAEMIEDVFTTHVRWELEHDLRHFMRRYMDIAEQRIGIWRIYFSAIGQIDEHSTELVSDVTSFRERLRAYFEEMIRAHPAAGQPVCFLAVLEPHFRLRHDAGDRAQAPGAGPG